MYQEKVHFSIFIIQTTIVIFGTFCNILSFIVWSKGKICRGLPIALYFRILAAVDTFILLVPGVELLLYVSPLNLLLRNLDNVTCRLYPGLTSSSIRISSWIIACFTIERTLYIYFPSKFRAGQNSTRTMLITFCLIVTSLLMDIPLFIRGKVDSMETTLNQTTFKSTANGTSDDASNATMKTSQSLCQGLITTTEVIIDGVTKFLLTLIILVICNTLILIQLRRQHRFSVRIRNKNIHEKRQANYKNAVYQLIGISFFHCVSIAPWSILAACREFGCEERPFYYELLLAFNSLAYLNSAINVLLYCAIGSSFRQDLKSLFCTKTKVEQQNRQIRTVSSRTDGGSVSREL